MGQQNSKKEPQNKRVRRKKKQDSDDEEQVDEVEAQANIYIEIEVLYELPGGGEEAHKLRYNPFMTARDFKQDLEHRFKLGENKAKVFFDTGTQEMPNDRRLKDIEVKDGTKLRLRDGSCHYY